MYADEIRKRAETAPRAALPVVASALWKAFGEGHLTEAEAEMLVVVIEARQSKSAKLADLPSPVPGTGTGILKSEDTPQGRQKGPRTGTGSRPRTDASLERRRRWAASGRLPPALASRFTLAEQAVLALIAAETARRGDCRLAIEHMGSVSGVSRSTVKAAIREARKLGLLTVQERRVSAFRNDTNVICIVSPEWVAWLRLARKGVADRDPLGRGVLKRHPIAAKGTALHHPLLPQKGENASALAQRGGHYGPTFGEGGGVKLATGTPTPFLKQGKTEARKPLHQRATRTGTAS